MDRRITLSQKKLKHAHILDRLINDSSFTTKQAAEAMGLSERHVKRLKGEYKKFLFTQFIEFILSQNLKLGPTFSDYSLSFDQLRTGIFANKYIICLLADTTRYIGP